jgi:uncharacterized membrane protein YesL
MQIAFSGVKKGLAIFWEDSILLMFFNILCFLSMLPALLFYNMTIGAASVVTAVLTTFLFLPLTFFLFALYHVLFDLRRGIHVSMKSYFRYLRSTWKPALIFGGINLLGFLLIGWNLRFYAQFEAAWAGLFQLTFLSISLVWIVLQMIMLPLYPRLEEPAFKNALKNAAAVVGHYLLSAAVLVLLTAVLLTLTFFFQVLGVFFTIVLIASLAEGIVGEVIVVETG